MTVQLKWVPSMEASDHRAQGWREISCNGLPEAVADAIEAITDAYDETDDGYQCALALESFWRSQPALRMTEEPEKVECPNCGESLRFVSEHLHRNGSGLFTCEPAQSEPAAPMEMPVLKVCPNCGDLTSEDHLAGFSAEEEGYYCTRPEPEQAKVCPNCGGGDDWDHGAAYGGACIHRMEPAQPYVCKPVMGYECPNCKEETLRKDGHVSHRASGDETEYYCKPAQVAAGEMPEKDWCSRCGADWTEGHACPDSNHTSGDDAHTLAHGNHCTTCPMVRAAVMEGEIPQPVQQAISALEYAHDLVEHHLNTVEYDLCLIAENLESFWRSRPALRMTPELSLVLQSSLMTAEQYGDADLLKAAQAVRAQAAQGVKLDRVREFLMLAKDGWFSESARKILDAALAELDRVEGK